MKYKYEFPVHPMVDTPKRTFRYVYSCGTIGVDRQPALFSLQRENAVGWIYAEAEKTPILEDGKWYLVRPGGTDKRHVRLYRNGCWHDGDSVYSFGCYIVTGEMQEVKE